MKKITSLLIGGVIAAFAVAKVCKAEVVNERNVQKQDDTFLEDWYMNHNILKLYSGLCKCAFLMSLLTTLLVGETST